jgi:hypothetical protein
MMSRTPRAAIRCPHCGASRDEDAEVLLRRVGMLRRETEIAPELIRELLPAAGQRLTCPACGGSGQDCQELPAEDGWADGGHCRTCGAPIPTARQKLYPGVILCVNCQHRAEQGLDAGDDREFCPRCGQTLQLESSRAGVTRYRWVCRSCGYRS